MAFLDRIKFDAPSDEVLVWKFGDHSDSRSREDIRLGAQLIVNQSQEAIFVKGGKALDVFGPGTHTLSSDNLPLLSKLINLPFGGKTPFTSEIWYVNKTAKRNMKWGTRRPIQVIDPKYNFPVSIRAFGMWGFRIHDSRSFLTQIVGTLPQINSDTVDEYFVGEIGQKLSNRLASMLVEQKISAFEINAKLTDISTSVLEEIRAEFGRFGIEIINFNVERVSIPDEEQKKFQEILGKRMEIEQISGAKVGQTYVTMRTFDTLEKAAGNEGAAGGLLAGGLGLGLGLGAGVSAGQQLGNALNPLPPAEQSQHPTPLAPGTPVANLQVLKQLLDTGLITQEDYDAKKKQILERL